MTLPAPHPAFAKHFTDPIYDATSVESAPFGSDEGADILWEWGHRRDELTTATTIADLMGTDPLQLQAQVGRMRDLNQLDEAAIVRGAAFTLLRLTGHLSAEDRQTVLRCIDYEIATTADPDWLPVEARNELLPALRIQREDLLSWNNPAH